MGRATDVEGIDFAGTTDPFIVRRGLRAVGCADEPDVVRAVLEAYVDRLRAELAVPGTVTVHAGIHRLLDALAGRPDVAVGLGTGNVEPGAWAKVGAGAIDEAFAFGGFGSDDEDRPTLLAIGARRGAATLGLEPAGCRVVVIGDTPRDLAAARAIGAECVLVATGRFGLAELSVLGAEAVFDTLEAGGAVGTVLGHGRAAAGGT